MTPIANEMCSMKLCSDPGYNKTRLEPDWTGTRLETDQTRTVTK